MDYVDFHSYKEQWIDGLPENTPYHYAQKLLCQWLSLGDEISEEFFFVQDTPEISFGYVLYGVEDEENANEENTLYLVYTDYQSNQNPQEVISQIQNVLQTKLHEKNDSITQLLTKIEESQKFVFLYITDKDEITSFDFPFTFHQTIFQTEVINIKVVYNRALEVHNRNIQVYDIHAKLTKNDKLLTGSISLLNLYKFMENYKKDKGDLDLIYQKNVRRYLGSRNKINKEMKNTISNQTRDFGLFNNGITMVVSIFAEKRSTLDTWEIAEPFIVNGCQTSKTIYETIISLKAKDSNWEKKLSSGIVMLKIVEIGNANENPEQYKELLKKITKYTNSQNAVKATDFITLEDLFTKFQEDMKVQYNLYLEIQRGGWDSQKTLQKNNPNIKPLFNSQKGLEEYANAFDLIKIYAAGWLRKPGLAFGKNPPFAPGGAVFKQITETKKENHSILNSEHLYACYLLKVEADKIQFGNKANDFWLKQTRYLFYFSIIEIIRDIIKKGIKEIHNEFQVISKSIIYIFTKCKTEKEELLTAVINLLQGYMTGDENTQSIFSEPEYLKSKDLNAFLKREKLGDSENYKFNLSVILQMLKRAYSGYTPYNAILNRIKEINS